MPPTLTEMERRGWERGGGGGGEHLQRRQCFGIFTRQLILYILNCDRCICTLPHRLFHADALDVQLAKLRLLGHHQLQEACDGLMLSVTQPQQAKGQCVGRWVGGGGGGGSIEDNSSEKMGPTLRFCAYSFLRYLR